MAKDPAFLFYYKDFEQDTADWEPEAIGWYVRLLCFQAGNGYIPAELEEAAQVARVKFSEFQKFEKSWKKRIGQKFSETPSDTPSVTPSDGKLVNKKLAKIQVERKEGAVRKSILATFGNYIKSTDLTVSEERHLKKVFREKEGFELVEDATERKKQITDFLNDELKIFKNKSAKRSPQRTQQVNGNANEDVNGNANINTKGGLGENSPPVKNPMELEMEDLKLQMQNEASWKETVCRNIREFDRSFNMEILDGFLEQFLKLIENDGETSKTVKDTKKHFSRWLKIEIEKKQNNVKGKSTQQNSGPSDEFRAKTAKRLGII